MKNSNDTFGIRTGRLVARGLNQLRYHLYRYKTYSYEIQVPYFL